MLLSIIIPVWNGASYIRTFLDRLSQLPSAPDFEVLFINDCSTDDTAAILDQIQHQYSFQIEIIYYETNRGVSEARNAGIKAAKGDWLYFADVDDRIAEDFFEKIIPALKSSVQLIGFNFRKLFLDTAGNIQKEETVLSSFSGIANAADVLDAVLESREAGYVWRFVFQKKLLIENQIVYDKGLPLFEDAFFLLKTLDKAAKVCFIPALLYDYMIRPSSAIHRFNVGMNSFPSYLQNLLQRLPAYKRSALLDYKCRQIYWGALRSAQYASAFGEVKGLLSTSASLLSLREIALFQRQTGLKGISFGLILLKLFPKLFFRYAQRYQD